MSTTTATAAPGRLPLAVPLGIGAAWVAAWASHEAGFAERFHHDRLGDGLFAGAVSPGLLAGFAVIWAVMIAAMMLPSTVPLLRLFAAASTAQPHRHAALASFVSGYMAVWTLFGAVALGLDGTLHRIVDALPSLQDRPSLLVAATFGLAGAFQFTALKDRCLSTCRHPAAYLLRHHRRRGAAGAFRLGAGHGVFCLGCCWAMMLVMFAVGITDLRWMAVLGAVMAYEKIGRHGHATATVTGSAALALAALAAIRPEWLQPIVAMHAH